jgi:phage/plasmid primase-like uncharacterized protein
MSAASIARQLGAKRQGRNWRCACPLDCGYGLSLSDGEDGRLLAFCFGGHQYDEIMPALVEFGLLDDGGDDSHVSRPVTVNPRDDAERIAHAREIYNSGVQDERIAVYLRSRGIDLTSPDLRFSERAPHRLGVRLPAMLAPVVNVNGEQTGVHMTFLKKDGTGKASLGHRDFQRECRGVIRGGAIRLMPFDPGVRLAISEGLETSLAASEILNLPCWSAVYAGGLTTLELPLSVRAVVVAADNDVSGAGQRNALVAHDRWRAEGRQVCIKTPPVAGTDFNDLLLARKR